MVSLTLIVKQVLVAGIRAGLKKSLAVQKKIISKAVPKAGDIETFELVINKTHSEMIEALKSDTYGKFTLADDLDTKALKTFGTGNYVAELSEADPRVLSKLESNSYKYKMKEYNGRDYIVVDGENSRLMKQTTEIHNNPIINKEPDAVGPYSNYDFWLTEVDQRAQKIIKANPGDETVKLDMQKEMIEKLSHELSPQAHIAARGQHAQIHETVSNNPKLNDYAKRFAKLNDGDKLEFAQGLVDEMSKTYCKGKTCQVHMSTGAEIKAKFNLEIEPRGLYTGEFDEIYIASDKLSKSFQNARSYDDFIDIVSHEFNHRIDRVNPNLGMHGQQRAAIAGKYYTNKGELYWSTLQEQGSYLVGGYSRGSYEKLFPPNIAQRIITDYDNLSDGTRSIITGVMSGLIIISPDIYAEYSHIMTDTDKSFVEFFKRIANNAKK
jgi:hypothetical protein